MRVLVVVTALVVVCAGAVMGQSGAPRAPRNVAEFDELFRQVSNWGRWGKDDQLGSANLVTEAKRKQAAALVKNTLFINALATF